MPLRVIGVLLGVLALAPGATWAQSFTFIPSDTAISAPLGTEIVFNCTIRNTSPVGLTLFLLRTMNDLPQGWESSMCVWVCYPPTVDSIATAELNPGDTLEFSLHVYSQTNFGTGIIRVVARNTHNSNDHRVLTFYPSSTTVDVGKAEEGPTIFTVGQNYPNPFNPSTNIGFRIQEAGFVSLKVFDVIGREVASLVNEELKPGNYEASFDGRSLASGVYLYKLQTAGYSAVSKMILTK